jgi:hypothetical protein
MSVSDVDQGLPSWKATAAPKPDIIWSVLARVSVIVGPLPEVTVRVAELLVALPMELETVAWKMAPLSEEVVAGVV